MINPSDIQKPTDKLKRPISPEAGKAAKGNIEKLTRQLERQGLDQSHPSHIAAQINEQATGPIAGDDWMKMDSSRFKPSTLDTLQRQRLTPDNILSNPDRAETYAGQVLALEGIPDGNGGVEKVRGVVPGHFDQTGHGIDLVAADAKGNPIPIEVKKYNQPSAAHLEDRPVTRLEPEVAQWKAQRESLVTGLRRGDLAKFRSDAEATWKPEVADWRKQIEKDEAKMQSQKGELPVQQMDDLWVRDRWLKLIKSPEGQARLRQAGVNEKFLNYRRLRTAPDLPEWQTILDRRMTVVVSDRNGNVGHRLFLQAIKEKRSKQVIKIEL